MCASSTLAVEKDENLVFALDFLRARETGELPVDHERGLLRMGNVLVLARAAYCHEAAHRIQQVLENRQLDWGGVEDQLLADVAFFMYDTEVRPEDFFNAELQTVVDLAVAARLYREARWLHRVWNFVNLGDCPPSTPLARS